MNNQIIFTPYFLNNRLSDLDYLIQSDWVVNTPPLPDDEMQAQMSAYHEGLAQAVSTAVSQNKRPVSIQGDCCATIGVMAGLQRAEVNPLFVWLDAHGDFNTFETTPSNFLGGMPLAMIAGLGDLSMCQAVGLRPFNQSQILLTDARDLDSGEQQLVNQSNITHFGDASLLLSYDFGNRPLYVHFDIDILNPLDMNAGHYLAEGGPRAEELKPILAHLAATGLITAVSMTSWATDVGDAKQAEAVCIDLLNVLSGS